MKLNIRQQKYKKNLLLGMNCYNAARAAGYSESTAKSRTKDINERIKIGDVLDRQGLTDSALIKRLTELIDAAEFVFKKNANGESEIIGEAQLYSPCWSARAKGLELALKLKEHLKDKVEHSGEIKGTAVQIIQFNDARKTDSPSPEARISQFDTPLATGNT